MATTARKVAFPVSRIALPAIALMLALAGCGSRTGPTATPEPGPPRLSPSEAVDLAWQALEPNSASHNRANWVVLEVRQVSGRSVAEEFEAWTFLGACGGPPPAPNGRIEPSKTYWHVAMAPLPATPSGPPLDPKGPPPVPEPSIYRAVFLIDEYGQVIARVLACVAY